MISTISASNRIIYVNNSLCDVHFPVKTITKGYTCDKLLLLIGLKMNNNPLNQK